MKALEMLARLFDDLPIAMEITGTRMQKGELAALLRDRMVTVAHPAPRRRHAI